MEVLTFLFYPFLGCVLLILIHAYFGIHILERGIIFVDLAMAQFIALGIALAFLMGHEGSVRNYYAVAFAVVGAFVFSMARRIQRIVNMEAFIGVLYIFSLAGSILILDRTPHGLEEFKSILNGNILWVTASDILKTFILYAAIGLLHLVFRKKFFALSYRGGQRPLLGIPVFPELRLCPRQLCAACGHPAGVLVSRDPGAHRKAFHALPDEDPDRRMGDRVGRQHGRHHLILQAGSAHGAADRRVLERRLLHPFDPADRLDAAYRCPVEDRIL